MENSDGTSQEKYCTSKAQIAGAFGHVPKLQDADKASRLVLRKYRPTTIPQTSCPFTQHSPLENDFTTKGTQGSLGCPYVANRGNGLPTPPGNPFAAGYERTDPIRAEIHRDTFSTSATSAAHTNQNKCPIRFLDQHSPEEVAQYFENHKHEIPRSHEICVKRYQKNSDSIKQLDAKYGNLVSMIQGLGVKHKQFLPEEEQGETKDQSDGNSRHDSRSVEKWAEEISGQSPIPSSKAHQSESMGDKAGECMNEEEMRSPHFERPLREVRVGESPSRPWGISVPLAADKAESAEMRHEKASSIPAPVPVDYRSNVKTRQQSVTSQLHHPVSNRRQQHSRLGRSGSRGIQELQPTSKQTSQMVFHGPVFFGYSSNEINQLLQSGTL